ncbi:hypothetical protein A6A04_11180 [Paramagnetospirillum marisnigri]|uniref:Uncharacterized protein n=1 Tax=Paramagnetospirillum marisnigri TaxID=1285242 RepID=A0A178MZ54_9PROT|nr:BPSL0067 family protein [Paramagnetospirillum marisnigri]OAN55218.1 hypothetical protein A6A04_11180 [Paramagnetospirillum marisnigri]
MPDNHYDPTQPRDDHGRWSDEENASAHGHVVKDIHRRAAAIIAGEKQVGKNSECVSLVKHLAPQVGFASTWEEGPPIRGYGKPPLEPGTAIATFTGGKYPSAVTGNHAAIFLEYGMRDGRQGI